MQNNVCSNCSSQIKTGVFSENIILSNNEIAIINEYSEKKSSYCTKCGTNLLNESKLKIIKEKNELLRSIEPLMDSIPVISSQSPFRWEYEIIGMVTGQSTTGTGIFSEFKSSFSDFFGAQSGSYNAKLKHGEDLCFNQIRKKALDIGGNAVIATDIDYSEVGGDKGMLMVCMAGTAIKLLNIEVIGNERSNKIKKVSELCSRLVYLNKLFAPNNI